MKKKHIATIVLATIAVVFAVQTFDLARPLTLLALDFAQETVAESQALALPFTSVLMDVLVHDRPHCDKMWVMSLVGDLGCVPWYVARQLSAQGWIVLEEYEGRDTVDLPAIAYENLHLEMFQREATGHALSLTVPELPTVGQSAAVLLGVESAYTASPVNSAFRITFVGALNVSSSDPKITLDEYATRTFLGKTLYTPTVALVPGGSQQFNITITPVKYTSVRISAVGFDEYGYFATDSADDVYLSIDPQGSEYQMGKDLHRKELGVNYIWTERGHPQCWNFPWYEKGMLAQDYYDDLGIAVLETKHVQYTGIGACLACDCYGGSVLFLTPKSDYEKIPPLTSRPLLG